MNICDSNLEIFDQTKKKKILINLNRSTESELKRDNLIDIDDLEKDRLGGE